MFLAVYPYKRAKRKAGHHIDSEYHLRSPPWEWRRRGSQETTKKACNIKGNINSKGDRIYHVPGGSWYGATKINKAKGERWFCSEKDAKAAGWRAAFN
jgi:hypothetical protein